MAAQQKAAATPVANPAPAVRVRRDVAVRYFRKPRVKLIRMGREVAVFSAAWGHFDLEKWQFGFRDAKATVESAELKAKRMAMDLPGNRLTAEGDVRLEEAGVVLAGDALTTVPSLAKLAFRGKSRIEADDQDAAVALLSAKGL